MNEMLRIQIHVCFAALMLAGCSTLPVNDAEEVAIPEARQELTPFVLPWDDASPGVTDLSGWLHKPAGKFGHVVTTPDGHLRVGDQRIRFFGTDLSHSANFPLKPDSEKIAARMAKFGINIVRFHIMDIAHFPQGLFRKDSPGTREFEPEAVDRMDYFIAQLKKNGIYVDLNLLNYRGFCEADGLPREIEIYPRPYNLRHMPGFIGHERHIELQKEYARMLLAHRNPYTGMTYTEDPAVAFVEICNENGLVSSWKRGKLDEMPEVFLCLLRRRWNDWLKARYNSTEALRQAWREGEVPLGDEMLTNAGPVPVFDNWELERNEGAEATMVLTDDVPAELRESNPAAKAFRIDVAKLGPRSWNVLLNCRSFDIEKDRIYTLTFWAKADAERKVSMKFAQTHKPFRNLSQGINPALTTEWQSFCLGDGALDDEKGTRIMIGDLGKGLDVDAGGEPSKALGTYWLAGVSLRPGGILGLTEGARVEDGSVPLLPLALFPRRVPAMQRDWIEFLRATEDDYWQCMYRYLKDDLRVKAQIIGTAGQYSLPSCMAKMDCVDVHGYWTHPHFLSKRRGGGPWVVKNQSMVNDTGGLFGRLSPRRILDKPFSVTEYGGASPNPHSGENLILGGAYAALQDWDYIAVSRYTLQVRDNYSWGSGKYRGFFDVDQHPNRMLGFIPAAAMFRRLDVTRAEKQVVVPFDKARELEAIRTGYRDRKVVPIGAGGLPPGSMLVHRVARATEGMTVPADALAPEDVSIPRSRYASDTGELLWDRTDEERSVVTVDTTRSKAVIGFGAGKRFDLGGVVIEPGVTRQGGWSVVSLTAIEGTLTSAPARILVIATGDIENKGMKWVDDKKESVGKNWGTGPTLVETIPARLTFPIPSGKVKARALDERGQRGAALTVGAGVDGNAVIPIGPPQCTLWYEIVAK